MAERENYQPTYLNSPGRAQSFAQGQPVYIVKAKSTVVAYILFIFFWWLGAHKFYLSQPFMGIFYILGNLIGAGAVALIPILGWIFYIPLGLVMLWDLFTIPVRVGFLNRLMNQRVY